MANTGWLGSGYAQLGFLGLLVYALFMEALPAALDEEGETVGRRIEIPVMLIPMLKPVTSSDVFTSVQTQGMFVGLQIMMMLSMRWCLATKAVHTLIPQLKVQLPSTFSSPHRSLLYCKNVRLKNTSDTGGG